MGVHVNLADGGNVLAHASSLTAHMDNYWRKLYVGGYFSNRGLAGTTTGAIVADRLHAVPFSIPRGMTFDRIAVEVTATGGSGKLIRLGIYNDGTNLYPGTLVLDAGTVAADAVSVNAITISQALTAGLYWLVLVSNGTPTLRSLSNPSGNPLGLPTTAFQYQQARWQVTFTYAALPTPFTAGGVISTTDAPLVALRLLSLD